MLAVVHFLPSDRKWPAEFAFCQTQVIVVSITKAPDVILTAG